MESTLSSHSKLRFLAIALILLLLITFCYAYMSFVIDLFKWLFLNENSQARLYKL